MNENPKVVIGIPVYNEGGYLPLLLKTIKWYTTYSNYEVVVVDDGSPDPHRLNLTRAVCAEQEVPLLEHADNRGVSASWNTLCQYAIQHEAEIIVILNNDLLVSPQWLTCAVYALQANDGTGRIGSVYWEPIVIPPNGVLEQMTLMHAQLWHSAYTFSTIAKKEPNFVVSPTPEYFDAHRWCAARCLAPNGSGFAFTREMYEQAGPFDEKMKSFHEESDFGVRCGVLGRFSMGLPYPRTYHGWSRTFQANPEVKTSERFAQSRAIFIEKWEVPAERRTGHEHFTFVSEKFLYTIPQTTVSALYPTGTQEEVETRIGKIKLNVLAPAEYSL